ncbi:MAG: nitrogenase molybdenum-iron protein subunit beta [Nitrospirae bacterium]|nr:nitrogenase molybdenum-iron protein subunit beta [Nitrospirota bacterium]MBF0618300.1 nitrogenase molybdenum-iron protein subunit beta [Nitrospirota bacterium]
MIVKDHNELFTDETYIKQFKGKREFENPCPEEEVQKTALWSAGDEYREKNFKREALVINPAKACQPLGAMLCALGFENTLNFVQGSQGCVAYFRSHLSRHFKEPVAAVSSSMTEDSAVFGGVSNMLEGLENAYTLYKPDMIAVSTTCMAEVIGDDLNSFIKSAVEKGIVPQSLAIPFAHTPSFVGSHITGYDNMMKGILSGVAGAVKSATTDSINIIPGFDTYTGNYLEIKRLMNSMGVKTTVLSDISDVLDSPNTGRYRLFPGGTPLSALKDSVNALSTVAIQKYSTIKTGEFIKNVWGKDFKLAPVPIGIENTDEFLDLITAVTGKAVSSEIENERGRAVDAMIDSHPYVHGKRFALFGDPDLLMGLMSFILEMGGRPVHILCTNGDETFAKDAELLLSKSPNGKDAKIYVGKDMWHLRSLLFTEPVDLLIGNSYAKFLWRDTQTPLVRIGFPLFDRHHLHRYPIIGYQGAINLTTWIVNTLLDEMDRKSMFTMNFDVIR